MMYEYSRLCRDLRLLKEPLGNKAPKWRSTPSLRSTGLQAYHFVIDLISGDIPVIAGQKVWVAVVVMDSSGNAHYDMLEMDSAESTDEGITDPGVYLPDIEEVEAEWFEENSIFVEWQHSVNANVRGYHIYISEEMFTSTDDATMVGETVSANSFLITPEIFDGLTNASAYYVAVVPYDDAVAKSTVEAVKLNALGGGDGDDGAGEGDGKLSLESLLTTPNLIAAGMFLIVVLLLVLVVRGRSTSKQRSSHGNCKKQLGVFRTVTGTHPLQLPRVLQHPPLPLHHRPASPPNKPTTSTLLPIKSNRRIMVALPTKQHNRFSDHRLTPRCLTDCWTNLHWPKRCQKLTPPSLTICCEGAPW